jgi:DNA-binding SARP family transcriptional activator
LRVLGPLELRSGGIEVPLAGRRMQALLSVLALWRGRPVPDDVVFEALWPGTDGPRDPAGTLRTYITRLRRSVGEDLVPRTPGGYQLLLDPTEVDVVVFDARIRAGLAMLGSGDHRSAESELRSALGLWQGRPWLPLAGWPPADADAVRCVELHAQAEEQAAACLLADGRDDLAVQELLALVELDPTRERRWALLMTALAGMGRHSEALQAYDRARRELIERSGLDLSPELEQLQVAILHHRPLTSATVRSPAPMPAPQPDRARGADGQPDGARSTAAPPPSTAVSGVATPAGTPAADPRGADGEPYVGRLRELREVELVLDGVLAGSGHVLTVTGEPGIGKTRTARHVTARAHAAGATVVWGQGSDRGEVRPYRPWAKVLRDYAASAPPDELRDDLGAGAPDLVQIAPSLEQYLPEVGDPPTLSAEQARFRMADSMLAFLGRAARRRPLVIVFDDLQWLDAASLQLLCTIAEDVHLHPLLLMCCVRDVDTGPDHPLAMVMAALARATRSTQVSLRGLEPRDVDLLLVEHVAGPVPLETSERIAQRTGGNPFFVTEIARLLVTGPGVRGVQSGNFALPGGVRDAVRARLVGLSPGARALLPICTVLGTTFSLDALQIAATSMEDGLANSLEELLRARLLVEHDDRPDRVGFGHSLLRDALYDDLPPIVRRQLHLGVADALDHGSHGSVDHLGAVAHHLRAAGNLVEPERLLEAADAAATQAERAGSYDEAAEWCEVGIRALDLLPGGEPGDAHRRQRRVTLQLGAATNARRGGRLERSQQWFRRAVATASSEAPELLPTAALSWSELWWSAPFAPDVALVDALQAALARVPAGNASLRSRVLSRLATALSFSGPAALVRELSDEAVGLAREVDDPHVLAGALAGRHAALRRSPVGAATREAVSREVLSLANLVGDRELVLEWRAWHVGDLLERGDRAAYSEIDAHAALAADLRQPHHLWIAAVFQAMRALLVGNFDRVEALVQRAYESGRRSGDSAVEVFGTQMLQLRWLQGRLGEMLPLLEHFTAQYPAVPAWRCTLAAAHLEVGNLDAAGALYQPLIDDLDALPVDPLWLTAVTQMAELAAGLSDQRGAARLQETLAPHRDLHLVVGNFGGAMYLGPVARHLGMLAVTLGQLENADRLLSGAVRACDALGSRPWSVRARFEHAQALLGRGGSGDAHRAGQMLDVVIAGATELGMSTLTQRATEAKRRLPEAVPQRPGAVDRRRGLPTGARGDAG